MNTMISEGIQIKIIMSQDLREMRLSGLAGRKGIITEDLTYTERKIKGCMVRLNEEFLGDFVWFIPIKSIQKDE